MDALDIGIDTATGNPIIENGDFVVAFSDKLHVRDIFIAEKGNWRRTVLVGIGIMGYINSPDSIQRRNKLLKAIRLQLEADGYKIGNINVESIENPDLTLTRIR